MIMKWTIDSALLWLYKNSIHENVMDEIYVKYNEPHRYYHNWKHIISLLNLAEEDVEFNQLSKSEKDIVYYAIIFHDVIYDPKKTDNEIQSAEYFGSVFQGMDSLADTVSNIIIETATHLGNSNLSNLVCRLDMEVAWNKSISGLIEYEHLIFKEFQFVDYRIYKEKRIEFLKDFLNKYDDAYFTKSYIKSVPILLEYLEARKPNIAVYAGSFNPFHNGHLNILEKAEKIFDKVIIARGLNPEKQFEKFADLPEVLNYRQVDTYKGLLTDYIDNLGYDVTLIRGLRNTTDLQYEMTQYRFIQDFKPDIKMVSIIADKEYDHISSSAIRSLKCYNKEVNYLP